MLMLVFNTATWGKFQNFVWYVFFDAAFATRSDGASQAGYVILMVNKVLL